MKKLTSFFLTLALFAVTGTLSAAPAAVKSLPKPDSYEALKLDPKEKNAAFNLAVLLLNSASQSGHGLTTKTVAKMRENSKDWLKNTADKDKVNMVSAILDWLDYLARQADSRTSEAKKWYQVAKENGLDPDPALEKVLK